MEVYSIGELSKFIVKVNGLQVYCVSGFLSIKQAPGIQRLFLCIINIVTSYTAQAVNHLRISGTASQSSKGVLFFNSTCPLCPKLHSGQGTTPLSIAARAPPFLNNTTAQHKEQLAKRLRIAIVLSALMRNFLIAPQGPAASS